MICAVEYTPTARQFLLRAKFGHRRELFEPLAGMLTAAIRSSGIRPDCVVPVPSHPWSGFTRGFSPATELARPVAHGLGRPLRRVVTRRWFPWTSAKRLSRAERLRFSVRAFRLSGNIEGQSILLVDDLVTTGSTLARCIRLCEEGGAVCVRVLVWASKQADDGG